MKQLWDQLALWTCRALGWHVIGGYDGYDGCSYHATCKRCGYRGLVDSQGNLF